MDWPQVLTFLGGVITIVAALIGVCAWFYKMTRGQIGAINSQIIEMQRESKEFRKEFNNEIKSFHGRLCTLEERYLQIIQKTIDSKADK
jgi:hypothetical protein